MKTCRVLALIPARGGSKGIPGKNIRNLAGLPLIAHTINHAIGAQLVDRVMVSTDDAQIGRVAKTYGAEVVWRPPEISGDFAPSEQALLHVLQRFRQTERIEPEVLVFLQATSPLRRSIHIDEAIQKFRDEGFDTMFSASPAHGFVWQLKNQNLSALTYAFDHRPMRQEIGEHLVENGSFYILRPRILIETGNRLGGRIGVYRMGFLEALQIDEPEDLALAERLLACRSMSEYSAILQ